MIGLLVAVCAAAAAKTPAPRAKPDLKTAVPPVATIQPTLASRGYLVASGSREWPIDKRLAQFTPRADSVWRRSEPAGFAFVDSLLQLARSQGDRTLAAAAHAYRGRKLCNDARLAQAKPDLDSAWALSVALKDSAGLCRVLAARGQGFATLGEYDSAHAVNTKLDRMATLAGLPGLVGFANRGMGMADKLAGRYDEAERHLRKAIDLIPPERFENRHSRFLLGEVRRRTGHHDEARQIFVDLLAEARARRDRWHIAGCLNDLGILEYEGGDMAAADQYWEVATAVFDSLPDEASSFSSRLNRAKAITDLGRWGDAIAMVDHLLEDAKKIPDPAQGVAAYNELGRLYHKVGRLQQAERILRSVRGSSTDEFQEISVASLELSGVLRDAGRPAEAEALMDSCLAPEIRKRQLRDNLTALLIERSAARRALGRPQEALADARAGERNARVDRSQADLFWLETCVELARCQRALGRPDSAVVVLKRAAAGWERWRSEISDLEWREQYGSGLAELFSEYGLALLDERRGLTPYRRAREAFDALQMFQARTLEERMHGLGLSGEGMRHRVGADSLRRGVLREGELLVDFVSTPDTTFAFLLNRKGLAIHLLPGSRRLGRLYRDWRDAALAGADAHVTAAGLRRLSEELLTPLAGPMRSSPRIVFTGGGVLALWPLAALTVPGEGDPICQTHEMFSSPSATLLATLRARNPASRPNGSGLLAVGRVTDARGRELPGAERELKTLGDDYARVEVRVNRGDAAINDLTRDLPRWDMLHFAAHAEAESGTPWRSGFLLGRGTGDDAFLRASSVAAMKLRARLAVLSGCSSAGVTTLAGEGAIGLASAFLCSGTSSVVATLWPVDDRVAQRFMAEFYEALAGGRSVAAAVGEAQRQLRARNETANPRDWAAFVAAGEGTTRVPLTRRGSARNTAP